MLSRLFTTLFFAGFLFVNSADASENIINIDKCTSIKVQKGFLKLQHPLRSSGVAYFKVQNNCSEELEVEYLKSPMVRRSAIYEERASKAGTKYRKEVKSVNLRANKITEFANGKFQVLLSGLDSYLKVSDEVLLLVKFKNKPEFKTTLTIVN